ncbi:MAG: NAD(+)/NADH kinase [Thermodesulfovibrionia bacterium]
MRKIGVIVKKGSKTAIDSVRNLLSFIDKKKFKIFVEDEIASNFRVKGYTKQKIVSRADVIIVFGGDGMLLSVARLVGNRGIPLLGVNLGGLGFITEISHAEISREIIEKTASAGCRFEKRIMLSVDVYRGKKKIAKHTALNDVVINKSALARMAELDVHINKKYVTTFRADGLIVSTPTGSTAHSLSAGGPILYPTLEVFVMTPICPHILTNRPLVLPDNSVLEISIKNGRDVYLTLDGQVGVPLKVKDRIIIRKADFETKFILLHEADYFQILRKKLKWGE